MKSTENGRIMFRGEYEDGSYWERVKRSLGWMGNTLEDARLNQERLRDATIGIAGTGGIGGAAAIRLIRMGARHLKIADPEVFDLSNIQRQAGASIDTLGRNKAEVVGEIAFDLTRDSEIEVFTEGLNAETAEDFVAGCDVVTDQIEVFEWDAKYALHRAFRASEKGKALYAVATIGHGALVHKYTRDSAPIEDLYQIPEGATPDPTTARILSAQAPAGIIPSFPTLQAVMGWAIEHQIAPIFGPAPATCEGVLLECICREVMDLPGAVEFPVRPGYAYLDTFSWRCEVVGLEKGQAELDQALEMVKAATASAGAS